MSKSEIMIDNNVTRVTKWSFLPGEDTGQHIHHYDYVVVPIIDGKLKIIDKNGTETISELIKGVSYFREKGVNHNVINFNDFPFSFVEIEFK
jgi:quercetin dioxygenase-like cupin family protein